VDLPDFDEHGRGLDRTIGFSDGVFAIAITLLVLSFRIPRVPSRGVDAHLLDALGNEISVFVGFVLSFYVIARFWLAHHRLSILLRRVDSTFIALNLVFLAAVVIIPYPTEIIGRYGSSKTAVVFYASALTISGVLSGAVWWYALRHRLVDERMTAQARREAVLRSLTTPLVFATSVPIAFVDAEAAKYWWILLVGQRWVSRRFSHTDEPSASSDHAG
jgi:uncharacterized membrane protein